MAGLAGSVEAHDERKEASPAPSVHADPVDRDDPVTKLLAGEFEPLRVYFDGYNKVSDLLELDESDLVGLVAPGHRLLVSLSLFFRRQLSRFSDMSDPFEAPPKLLLSEHVKGSTLNLRHKVSASAYAHLNPDQFNMELLLRNGDFVKLFPACEVVDLSFNRFYGKDSSGLVSKDVDEALVKILSLETVKFVCVIGNPMASVDRRDLFDRLQRSNVDLFLKLIWVPSEWLKSGNWASMVGPDANLQEKIRAAHRAFFERQLEH